MGACSHDNSEIAAIKALREACTPIYFSRGKPRPVKQVLEKMDGPVDHIELFASGEYDHLLLKLFNSAKEQNFNEIPVFSGNIVERLHHKNFKVYISDMTTKRVR